MRPNIVREPDRWKRAWSIKFFLVDQNNWYWSVGSSCHFRQWLKLCWFNESQTHSNVDNQVSLLSDKKDIMWSCKGVSKPTLTMLPVHAMSWISDLTMCCHLFFWLKHFKIPPARILQSHVLELKAGNAFSVLSHA